MNDNQQVEAHDLNTGFPYSFIDNIMDFFEGLVYTHADFFLAEPLHEQESTYWPMQTSPYKYGLYGSGGSFSFNPNLDYWENHLFLRTDGGMGGWHNPPVVNSEEPPSVDLRDGESSHTAHVGPEECIRNQSNASGSQGVQVIWQDDIDPDNMTYEELLDLGEKVGTQNRGLSQERISSLPVSKFKCCFFLRKKKRCERCVVCQMVYKRGDRLMTLPCKHIYHANCISRWLGINKACPVCLVEVPSEEIRQ